MPHPTQTSNFVPFDDLLPMLTPYGREFFEIEFGRGKETYLKRIDHVGLCGLGKVLDAGGGIGQWALALAETNQQVEVLDQMSDRLLTGYTLARRSGIQNISFRYGSIEALPYPDAYFDGIICYSVMMFADGNKSAREFARVLKPGGKLYVMIDLWRWYAVQMTTKFGWRSSLKLFAKRLLRGQPQFYTSASFSKLVSGSGFVIVSQGQEGHASFESSNLARAGHYSFFPTQPKGREQLWEICAIRHLRPKQ